MFSFFRKKAPSYPSESKWTVLDGKHNGLPLIVRRNDSARELRGHAAYQHRVGVAIPLRQPDANGLPMPEEITALNDIEDALATALESQQDALQVLAVTTNSMREFVFYTRVPAEIESRLRALQESFSSHEIQFYVAEDPEWQGFTQFA